MSDVTLVPLTHGYKAIIDAADAELVLQFKWHVELRDGQPLYARANIPRRGGPQRMVRMHRLLMQPPAGLTVDHINRNPLDNRRCNLRVCAMRDNARNRPSGKRVKNFDIPYKGVSRRCGRFCANLHTSDVQKRLGQFDTMEEAARAWDRAALAHYGEFAALNFPEDALRRSTEARR